MGLSLPVRTTDLYVLKSGDVVTQNSSSLDDAPDQHICCFFYITSFTEKQNTSTKSETCLVL